MMMPSLPSSLLHSEIKHKYNDSATWNNMKFVHWPLMGGLLRLVLRREDWAWPQHTQAPHDHRTDFISLIVVVLSARMHCNVQIRISSQ